jgi:CDP-glucose 4,6-dehydratase
VVSWRGKNVLVTGINGLIGSNVARMLLYSGANVVGIVRDASHANSDLFRFPNLSLFPGNVTDYRFLREVISTKEVEYVYHFAAYSIVRISAHDPLNAFDVNVMGTVALLEAARNVGNCKRIVVASSDKAYGDHDELPYTENHALQPRNTYDASKACADIVARTFASNYGMPVVVTRCSNVYGPGDYNLSRIVPNTIRRLYNGERPLLYSDVEGMEREFIYVDDVVDAYDRLGRLESPEHTAYNIGGLGPMRIRDLVSVICQKFGRPDVEPEIVQRDNVFREIQRQYIDSSRLARETGWAPRFNVGDGIHNTILWYQDLYRSIG